MTTRALNTAKISEQLPYEIVVDFSQGATPANGYIIIDSYVTSNVTINTVYHTVGSNGGVITSTLQVVNTTGNVSIVGLTSLSTNNANVISNTATSNNIAYANNQLRLYITNVTGTPVNASFKIRGTVLL